MLLIKCNSCAECTYQEHRLFSIERAVQKKSKHKQKQESNQLKITCRRVTTSATGIGTTNNTYLCKHVHDDIQHDKQQCQQRLNLGIAKEEHLFGMQVTDVTRQHPDSITACTSLCLQDDIIGQ